jgi:hypothetical protein
VIFDAVAIYRDAAFESAPPLLTVIAAEPAVATSDAEMAACSSFELTRVVGRALLHKRGRDKRHAIHCKSECATTRSHARWHQGLIYLRTGCDWKKRKQP